MKLVPALCTTCGAPVHVDPATRTAVCDYCGNGYLIEEAINKLREDFDICAGVLKRYKGPSIDVMIPDGVVDIEGAFDRMKRIRNVTIPNSVKHIGNFSFRGCEDLTTINVPDGIVSIGNYAFSGCQSLTGDITLPSALEKVGRCAFSGCSRLTSVRISNNVKAIEDYAFSDCAGMTSVYIPFGVESIGKYAFSGCSSLLAADIPDSVTQIGDYAFLNCVSLMRLNIPMPTKHIGKGLFYGCNAINSVDLPYDLSTSPSQFLSNAPGLNFRTKYFNCRFGRVTPTLLGFLLGVNV